MGLESILNHELTTYPASLFENSYVMRKADKPQLAHAIKEICGLSKEPEEFSNDPEGAQYILDGGSLLHSLSWQIAET